MLRCTAELRFDAKYLSAIIMKPSTSTTERLRFDAKYLSAIICYEKAVDFQRLFYVFPFGFLKLSTSYPQAFSQKSALKKCQLIRRFFHRNRFAIADVYYIGKLLVRKKQNADFPVLRSIRLNPFYKRRRLIPCTAKAKIDWKLAHLKPVVQ